MAQLLALVLRALSVLGELLGIAQIIRGFTENGAQERRPFSIENYSGEILAALQNPTTGLATIHADLADGITDILAAFDGLCQSGTSPSWWVDPPTPPDTDSIAYAIWTYQSAGFYLDGTNYNLNMEQVAEVAASRALLDQAWYGVPLPECPFFAMCVGRTDFYGPSGWSWGFLVTLGRPAWPDWTQALATDTAYTFLARTQAGYGWSLTGPGGYDDGHTAWKDIGNPPISHTWIKSNFTELDMMQLSSLVPPPPPQLPPPPVYPGAGGITLGTPVALDEDTTIPGPMHGVNIAITTPPHGLGKFSMGGRTWWYRLGQIAFVDDAGNVEPWQYISWDLALYTPSRMTEADHAIVRLLGGAEGTGTPWTRTE